jgi:hypothetical protein
MATALQAPRLVRPTLSPLGLYLRTARGDGQALNTFLELRGAHFHGLVFDPCRVDADKELREAAAKRKLDVVLDPRTQESALPGAFTERLGNLPWGVGRAHEVSDFVGVAGKRRADAIADFVIQHGFTKVLAPSHFIRDASDDWLAADIETTARLRESLDARGAKHLPIAYSLAFPYAVFRDADEFGVIVERLKAAVEDELWLKVEGFGSAASPTGVRNYVESVRALHHLDMAVIADHVGGLAGLSLLAFGGVGGLSHGVTLRESFNAKHWMKPKSQSRPFAQHHRVYLPEVDMHVSVEQARQLLERGPLRSKMVCQDPRCCARGATDMVEQPGLHFLTQRVQQFGRLSEVPEQLRPSVFLEEFVRRASDRTMVLSNLKIDDAAFKERVKKQRQRLDALREALGAFAVKRPPESFAPRPYTRLVREDIKGVGMPERRSGL